MGALSDESEHVNYETAPATNVVAPADPGALTRGTALGGRYEILRRLGAGGMGAVYEAVQHPLERRVAVKVLNPLLATDPEARRRFSDEGRVASRVRHPNVVEIIDQGVDGVIPYLVMELLEGESLGERMERVGRFEPSEAVALLAPVLRALAFLHKRGVVHRDLKPDNLFLARDGDEEDVPKILDLGIAVALRDASLRVTGTGVMLGTPAYMAPEQIRSARDVTGAADQYAMGCVLYEMLTGRLPIEADSLQGMLAAKLVTDPRPITEHLPALRGPLAAVIMRAVSTEPASRFDDALALLASLEGALALPEPDRSSSNDPPPAPAETEALPVAGADLPLPEPDRSSSNDSPGASSTSDAPSRVANWRLALALGVLTATVVFAALALRPPPSRQASPPPTVLLVSPALTIAAPQEPPPGHPPPLPVPARVAPGAAPSPVAPTATPHLRRRSHTGRLTVDPSNPLRPRRP